MKHYGPCATIALVVVLAICGFSPLWAVELVDAGTPFGMLPLIDEIQCGDPKDPHELVEKSKGISEVQTLLGQPCRVLPNETGGPKYFAYRIGAGKGLKAGNAYVLTVEYPDNQPRTMFILNRGCEAMRGLHTGKTLGDTVFSYTNNNLESLDVPLTGKMQTWQQYFHLEDLMPGVSNPRKGSFPRNVKPAEGFWVVIAQAEPKQAPLSKGAAVARIRLFAVPNEAKFNLKLNQPPKPLPKRRIFWREEMSDGAVGKENAAYKNSIDFFENKAKLMKFLGVNTFGKDLLEFGHNQGWDSGIYGGNNWVYQSHEPQRWQNILTMLKKYDLDVIPYYEYAGSVGQKSIGKEKRAKPLGGGDTYTHIKWSEKANCDVTDPECAADLKKVLDATIVRHKNKGHFVGAWIRPRPSAMPIGFGDRTLARFAKEANGGKIVTRQQLQTNKALLNKYYGWWFQKRKEFLVEMRNYLKQKLGQDDILLLYTADASEPGCTLKIPGGVVVTDDLATWNKVLSSGKYKNKAVSLQDVVSKNKHLEAALSPPGTWGKWEWQHASPQSDPQNYKNTPGILMTYTFNRLYTAMSPSPFEAFRNPAGLAIARHYALNEGDPVVGENGGGLGYFTCEMERTGPYIMMAEAQAVANGDPTIIAYLAGNHWNSGAPEYTRNFFQAFLALPALPSKVLRGASTDRDVVVRAISTDKNGTYLAVVNKGIRSKKNVTITLPLAGKVTDAATGEILETNGTKLTLSFYPCQLRAIHIKP